jgi:hypothetical protein
MHPVSRSFNRSSSAICSSSRPRQRALSRAQSAFVGVRPLGSDPSASLISSRVRPTRWAMRTNATRRNCAWSYRRWFPLVRSALIKPSCS